MKKTTILFCAIPVLALMSCGSTAPKSLKKYKNEVETTQFVDQLTKAMADSETFTAFKGEEVPSFTFDIRYTGSEKGKHLNEKGKKVYKSGSEFFDAEKLIYNKDNNVFKQIEKAKTVGKDPTGKELEKGKEVTIYQDNDGKALRLEVSAKVGEKLGTTVAEEAMDEAIQCINNFTSIFDDVDDEESKTYIDKNVYTVVVEVEDTQGEGDEKVTMKETTINQICFNGKNVVYIFSEKTELITKYINYTTDEFYSCVMEAKAKNIKPIKTKGYLISEDK